MGGASDARIQAFGRWLNPDSIKIYARISKEEYAEWIDKLMAVRAYGASTQHGPPASQSWMQRTQ